MSSFHYSQFRLNTWSHTPYFEAHAPAGFEVMLAAVQARAYLNLPPGIRSLCEAAHAWAIAHDWEIVGYWQAYNTDGQELDPQTQRVEPRPAPLGPIVDIRVPAGGWPNPAEWEAPPEPEEEEERFQPTVERLRSDVESRGIKATAYEYGMTVAALKARLATS